MGHLRLVIASPLIATIILSSEGSHFSEAELPFTVTFLKLE